MAVRNNEDELKAKTISFLENFEGYQIVKFDVVREIISDLTTNPLAKITNNPCHNKTLSFKYRLKIPEITFSPINPTILT